jgi:hypothetical protein
MAGRSVDLLIKVVTDASKAASGLDQASGKVGKFQKGLGKMAVPAGLAIAAVGGFAVAAGKAASDVQQSMGAVDSVFGDSAGQVKKWSDQSATTVGLAKSEYGELASVLGAQLKNMGVPMDQVAGKTNDLITMGSDLAATYGGSTAEAVQALGSALKGETDPIERYGISIKQADIAARQAKDGTAGLTGEAGKAAKTAALLSMATEQAGGAMGQFARETDSAAGSQQIASAQWEDAQAALGEALLPAMSAMAGLLGSVAGLIKEHSTLFMVLVGVIAAVAAVILVLNVAVGVYTTVTTAAGIASSIAWLAALGPILLVIAAVLLVVGAVVLLWKKSQTFRTVVLAVWAAIKTAALAVANWVKAAWSSTFAAVSAVVRVAGAVVRAVFSAVRAIARLVFAAISAYVRAWLVVVRAVFSAVRAVASAVGNAIKAVWRVVFAVISAYVRAYAAVFRAVFNGVRAVASSIANTVKAVWSSVFAALKRAASGMASALSGPFHLVASAVNTVVNAVRSLIGWLGRIKIPKISLPHIPGFNSATATGNAAPALAANGRRAATPAAASQGAGLTIVIQGAIDPEATARQVRRILAAHDRRMGTSGAGLRTGLV